MFLIIVDTYIRPLLFLAYVVILDHCCFLLMLWELVVLIRFLPNCSSLGLDHLSFIPK